MPSISRFNYDHWERCPLEDLKPGDIIVHRGASLVMTGLCEKTDGKWHVPAAHPEQGPIRIAVNNPETQNIYQAMDCVGSDLTEFGDGTGIIADIEGGDTAVFSPRLPIKELDAFCKEHMGKYDKFYRVHREAIDNGERVMMRHWWEKTSSGE